MNAAYFMVLCGVSVRSTCGPDSTLATKSRLSFECESSIHS